MVTLRTPSRGLGRARRSNAVTDWWSLVVAAIVTATIGLSLPHEPDRVTVTIDNPLDHRLYVDASAPDDPGRTFVMIIEPRSTRSMPHVIDRGDEWVLHLRTRGAPAGTLTVSGADVAAGPITIPASVGDALVDAGVPDDLGDLRPSAGADSDGVPP